jgi:hypothetical protein
MSVSAVPCGSAASKDNRVALLSFLADAARIYGRVCAAVIGAGLMIAAIATAEELPLSPPPTTTRASTTCSPSSPSPAPPPSTTGRTHPSHHLHTTYGGTAPSATELF